MVEQWVRSQLRTAWGLSPTEIRDSSGGQLWLDDARRVELIPDLAVRSQGEWCFVGDVKYKALRSDGARQDDVYQMLAYLTATGLSDGTLIYVDIHAPDEMLYLPQDGRTIRVAPSTSTVTRRRKFYYSMWANPCLNRLDRRPYPHHSRPYQMDRASLEMRERGTAMTPKLVTVTRGELLARRSDVLEQLGMSLEEFNRLREMGTLAGNEWFAAEDLDEIEFLLRGVPE